LKHPSRPSHRAETGYLWRLEEELMSVVRDLYQLQLVDTESRQKGNLLEEVNSSLGETAELIRARKEVEESKKSLAELKSQLRGLDLDVASVSAKLTKNQDRLYSGKVRNPKELSNLQEEAAALGRHRDELEDSQLELLIEAEAEEAEVAEREARLGQIEANWRADQARLEDEKQALEVRLKELKEERSAMRARIGAAELAGYDERARRLGGVAVVRMKRGVCQGCRVDVPTGVARAVERGEGMHYCTVCNRLLYGG
jgi:predicted  nucleic acid-binding Zn-ribbon protein